MQVEGNMVKVAVEEASNAKMNPNGTKGGVR